jgi:hypothetical protein
MLHAQQDAFAYNKDQQYPQLHSDNDRMTADHELERLWKEAVIPNLEY